MADDQIVEQIRKWSVERGKCGFNAEKSNRISNEKLFPLETMLKARGDASISKLVSLTKNENPEVRLVAASIVFEVAPEAARHTLLELMARCDRTGILAWGVWAYKDPSSVHSLHFTTYS